ncbi:MAG: hypothetical protein ACREN4_09400 [Candidatus Dormibacteria bacterium]
MGMVYHLTDNGYVLCPHHLAAWQAGGNTVGATAASPYAVAVALLGEDGARALAAKGTAAFDAEIRCADCADAAEADRYHFGSIRECAECNG